MMDWIIWSTTSDFCATRPSVLEWMKNQAGHIAIGMVLGLTALLSRPLAAIVLAGLLGKELAYDMPDCDVQTVIVLDSPCDLGFYLLGIQLALFLDGKMPAAASMLIDINANGRTPSLPHHSAPPMRSTEQSIAVSQFRRCTLWRTRGRERNSLGRVG